jgi:hypothetical protein
MKLELVDGGDDHEANLKLAEISVRFAKVALGIGSEEDAEFCSNYATYIKYQMNPEESEKYSEGLMRTVGFGIVTAAFGQIDEP